REGLPDPVAAAPGTDTAIALQGIKSPVTSVTTKIPINLLSYQTVKMSTMSKSKRVGVLTGGGDAPGLNPAIKGLVYRGAEFGLEVVGLYDGWRGLINPRRDVATLDRESVR